jgi:hypothetical protein
LFEKGLFLSISSVILLLSRAPGQREKLLILFEDTSLSSPFFVNILFMVKLILPVAFAVFGYLGEKSLKLQKI